MGKSNKKLPAFEHSLQELESLIQQMESGDLDLESSIAHFEQGMKLYKQCNAALENAQQRVDKLLDHGEHLAASDEETP